MSAVERLRKHRERRAVGHKRYVLELDELAVEFMLQRAGLLRYDPDHTDPLPH
jgi:hypothetical protein